MTKWGFRSKSFSGKTFLAIAGAMALVVGTAACGGGGGGGSSESTSGTESGTVYAGGTLIRATVCIDADNDLACDSGKKTTTTDKDGKFTLSEKGTVLVTEGYDMDSLIEGKTMEDWTASGTLDTAKDYFNLYIGALQAPSGSAAVTPATTMVQALVADGKTVAEAETNIKKSLGITGDVSLVGTSALSSLTNQTAMAGIQALGRMFRQASTAIGSAAGIDSSTTTLSTMSAASFKDMRNIFKQVASSAAASLNTNATAAAPVIYVFSDTTTSTAMASFVSGAIKNAYTAVAKDANFSAATALNKINPEGIAAIAEDSIVTGMQNVAGMVKAADFSKVAPGNFAGLQQAVTSLQNAGMYKVIGASERADVVADTLRDPLFQAMITTGNMQGSGNTATGMNADFRIKIKGIGTELSAVQTSFKTNNGNVATAGADIMKAMTGAYMQVAFVGADTTNFNKAKLPSTIELPTTANVDKMLLSFSNSAGLDKKIYGAAPTDAQKGTLLTNMSVGMGAKFTDEAKSGKNTAFVVNDTVAANILGGFVGRIGEDANFAKFLPTTLEAAVTNQVKLLPTFVADPTKLGTALATNITDPTKKAALIANVATEIAKSPGTTPGTTPDVTAGTDGFKLAGNVVTVNNTDAPVSSTGTFAITSFAPGTTWGGVDTLSFTAKVSGATPLGSTKTKSVKIGIEVVPTNTADKRRLSMVIDQVNFNLDSSTFLTANVPVASKMSYAITGATGGTFTATLANTKADAITVSSDNASTTGAKVTLNASGLIPTALGGLASKDSSLNAFTMASGAGFTITTVIEGVALMDKDGTAYTTGTVTANGVTLTGSKLSGTVTVR